jgi:tRNA A58 N-methylase Trm61
LALKRFAYSGLGRERWQQPGRVVAALGLRPGQRVADLGAGSGYFTFRLAAEVGAEGRVYAVDTDPDTAVMIEDQVARGEPANVAPVRARPDDPDLPEPVDLILVVNAFHHLPEPVPYLRTLASYLRPGGRLAVIEPLPRWFLFGHATEPERIRATLVEAGFSPAATHEFLRRQSFQTFQTFRADPAPGDVR